MPLFSRFRRFVDRLSLKARLWLVFCSLMALGILFSGVLVYHQNRIAITGSVMAIRAHEEMTLASELRESLSEIQRRAELGVVDETEVSRFRRVLAQLSGGVESIPLGDARASASALEGVRGRFDLYVAALGATGRASLVGLRARHEDVAAAVGTILQMNESLVYRMAESLRLEQQRAMRFAIVFLLTFILVIAGAGYWIISVITRPLASLVGFLDEMDLEGTSSASALPASLESSASEVGMVARSFERLFRRLQGYRALNVRRLLLEKRRADVIAASISDGIILMRGEEIMYVNPIGEKILAGPQPKGMSVSALAAVAGGNRGAQAIASAIGQTMPVEFMLEIDDRKFHYLIRAYPIAYDIIERAEHLADESGQDPFERFQANTMVLAQDVTLVRESQDAKSHFLGTLSHEVKTPVTSLTMATRLLKKHIDQIPNPSHRQLIETCVGEVDRLRGLLDDFLTASRFDTLTERLEVKNVDFGKLIRHAVQSFAVQAHERGIELSQRVHNEQGLDLVTPMDPTKISWAISNLVINALRHAPRGGKVEVEAFAHADRVELRVRDDGPGIERSRQERIFDKFNSNYDIRVGRTGGAGVGLAIAREIVVAHGGRIWVDSEPGQGARFSFEIPLRPKDFRPGIIPSPASGRNDLSRGISMKGRTDGTNSRS